MLIIHTKREGLKTIKSAFYKKNKINARCTRLTATFNLITKAKLNLSSIVTALYRCLIDSHIRSLPILRYAVVAPMRELIFVSVIFLIPM